MSLARRIVAATRAVTFEQLPAEVVEKVKVCFMDFLSAAYESLDLPCSQQAMRTARRVAADQISAPIIGSTKRVSPGDSAFVNSILGHGLVRQDRHTGSVSHLGVVVFPTLMALANGSVATLSPLLFADTKLVRRSVTL